MLSMSSHDQTDWLHNHLAAADKCTNPNLTSARRTSFHISELWIWAMPTEAVCAQQRGKPPGSKAGLASSVGLLKGCQFWSWFLFKHLQALEKFRCKSKTLSLPFLFSLNRLPEYGIKNKQANKQTITKLQPLHAYFENKSLRKR